MGSEKLKKVIRLPYLDDGYVADIIDRFDKGLNKGRKIIFNVPNTKGMQSESIRRLPQDALIRVAGGYPDKYVDFVADAFKDDPDGFGDWAFDCVVYNKDELADILQVLENIEKGIDKDWSEKKCAVYLYISIMDRVVPYMEDEPTVAGRYLSTELRSLRGFVNKISICGGFALMYKELCDRNGIQCNMVLGEAGSGKNKGSHAWNELTIDGKKYPVDLMWDVGRKYQSSMGEIWEYFARDLDKFNKEHVKGSFNKEDSETPLRSRYAKISNAEMRAFKKSIGASATVEDAYALEDESGNKTVFGQIGSENIGSHRMYKYLVMHEKEGVWSDPQVVVSDSCISLFMKHPKWVNCEISEVPRVVFNGCWELFSQENLERARINGTSYIGRIHDYDSQKKTYVVGSLHEADAKSYKARKYKAERNLKELSTGNQDGMCVQLVGQSDVGDGIINKYNCYRFVMNPTKTGQSCRMRIVKDSFESDYGLKDITTEEVMGKVEFDTILAFARGEEPVIEK